MPRDKETTYRIMSAIKSKGTTPEKLLGSALWRLGLRYRKHYKIAGRPDFVFPVAKVAVFCDGDFWHGNNWRIRGLDSLEEELSGYSDFWVNKIKTNITRDRKVNRKLRSDGWKVIRIWESDIKKSPERSAKRVKKKLETFLNPTEMKKIRKSN